jgi:hypothetical protein
MKYEFAVEVEAEDAEALKILVSATEKCFKSLRVKILERLIDKEDCTASFHVTSTKQDLGEMDCINDLPGKVEIEPL